MQIFNFDGPVNLTFSVIPTEVGIYKELKTLDFRLHGNDPLEYLWALFKALDDPAPHRASLARQAQF